jgi:hypothetical protein
MRLPRAGRGVTRPVPHQEPKIALAARTVTSVRPEEAARAVSTARAAMTIAHAVRPATSRSARDQKATIVPAAPVRKVIGRSAAGMATSPSAQAATTDHAAVLRGARVRHGARGAVLEAASKVVPEVVPAVASKAARREAKRADREVAVREA